MGVSDEYDPGLPLEPIVAAEALPGLHRGALVWGPLPGDGARWTAAHPAS